MTRILTMPETIPLTEAKAKLSEYIELVDRQHDRITITKNGRPAAILLSPDDLESLELTIEELSVPGALEALRRADEDIAAGRTIPAEEAFKDLL